MPKPARMPERGEVDEDTPLRLDVAAAIAYPDGSITAQDLKRAIREGRLTHELVAGITFVTLGYIADMEPGAAIPKPSAGMGLVYVAGFGPYVKIGFTKGDVDERIASLATGCPEQIVIYAVLEARRSDETALHRRFSDLRLRGEWFRHEGALTRWIEAGCPT